MIVQVINSALDLGDGVHFNLQIPGGGVGSSDRGCKAQWGAPKDGWGSPYGGVRRKSECQQLPEQLQAGCRWRFEWFKGAENPTFDFRKVSCPKTLTDISGCKRLNE